MKRNFSFTSRIITAFTLCAASISAGIMSLANENNKSLAKAADVASYYSSADTSSAANLFNSLVSIESSAKVGGYGDLWTIYQTAYVKSDGKIKDYYSNTTSFTPGTNQCGSSGYSKEGDCYNREHSIPKSWWGGGTTNQGADPFIVVPTDGYVNNQRSSYGFGEVSSATYTSESGCKKGTGTYGGTKTATVFEPFDSVKGDYARIVFYARVRWKDVKMTTGDGSKYFTGSNSTNYGLTTEAIALFTKWSNLDPVDDWEMSVNDKIHASSTYGNRNPFIDHPEWANIIWGGTPYTGGSTGDLNKATITLNKTSASVDVGSNINLTATTSDGSDVSWSVSNGYAKLSTSSTASGGSVTVTGVSAGSVTVYAQSANDSTVKTSCAITVNAVGGTTAGIELDKTNLTMSVGGNDTIKATTTDSSSINWTTSDSSVVSLSAATSNSGSSITLTAKAEGSATITATSSSDPSMVGSCVVTVGSVTSEGSATYTIKDKSSVTTTGDVPTGSSATFSNTYSTATQLTSGKVATLTLSGYSGKIIDSITLSMKSNGSSGAGYLSVTAGTTTLASIGSSSSGVAFNNASWNGAWSTSYVDIKPTISNYSYAISSNEDVVITIGATENSLYIQSYTIGYSSGSSSSTVAVTGVTLTPSTLDLDLNGTKTGTLTPTVAPTNATNKNVTWSSSNEAVATVSNGEVTAVKTGSATITVQTEDGKKTATCKVTVTDSSSSGESGGSTSDTLTILTSIDSIDSSAKYVLGNSSVGFHSSGTSSWGKTSEYSTGSCLKYTLTKNGTTFTAKTTVGGTEYYLTVPTSNDFKMATTSSDLILGTTTTVKSGETAAYAVTNSSTKTRHIRINGTSGLRSYDGTTGTIAYFYKVPSTETIPVTGVTLDPTTLALDVTGTKTGTLTAAVEPTNATNKNVTWSSSNETVATVSNGVVTAVAAGTATITVKTNDGGYTATCEVTVTNTGGEITTSSSPYYNGVPYKFQLPKDTPYYFTGTMTGYYGATSTTLSKGVDTYFEANGDGQNIYFYDSSNVKQYISIALSGTHINFVFNTTVPDSPWLYDFTNKYLYYTISSTNYVMGLNGTYTTISADTVEGAASTTFYHATFKLTDVGFAKLFLSAFNCDSTGTTAPTFNISWDKLSSEYSSLLADYQTSIKGATGNQTGTDIEKAVARYDYVVAKYGYDNFINRSILSANQINILNNKGNNLVILTVILSAASVVSLCSLFVFKKKKD